MSFASPAEGPRFSRRLLYMIVISFSTDCPIRPSIVQHTPARQLAPQARRHAPSHQSFRAGGPKVTTMGTTSFYARCPPNAQSHIFQPKQETPFLVPSVASACALGANAFMHSFIHTSQIPQSPASPPAPPTPSPAALNRAQSPKKTTVSVAAR